MHLTIKNQIVNHHSMPFSVRKVFGQIVQRLSKTNAKTSCLNPWSDHYSQKGQFSLTIKSCGNRDLSYLKTLFTGFMQFCGPWITDKKNGIPKHLG